MPAKINNRFSQPSLRSSLSNLLDGFLKISTSKDEGHKICHNWLSLGISESHPFQLRCRLVFWIGHSYQWQLSYGQLAIPFRLQLEVRVGPGELTWEPSKLCTPSADCRLENIQSVHLTWHADLVQLHPSSKTLRARRPRRRRPRRRRCRACCRR